MKLSPIFTFIGMVLVFQCSEILSYLMRNLKSPKKIRELYTPVISKSILKRVTDPLHYTPPEVGFDIYIGALAGTIPFFWATYRFSKRIQIQRQCEVCQGSGLVHFSKSGKRLDRLRKCWNCGGFLPWIGWKMFFLSSLKEVGNGGPLQQPSRDYQQTNEEWRKHARIKDEKDKPKSV